MGEIERVGSPSKCWLGVPLKVEDKVTGVIVLQDYEDENAIVLTAELPGVEKEDLYVDTKGKLVTLGGERKSDEKITDEHSYRRERNYGKFERSFNLPFEINTEKVTATFNNGILKLEIPKPEEETTSKVTIQ